MGLKNKALSLGLSAAMLMTPAATLAESNYAAGELTTTAISDGYVGGNQINLSAALGMTLDGEANTDWWKSLASLLNKTQLEMSFYDDFGTARIHANVATDGVTLLTADVLVYEDGSVQMMTNLTGKLVLALPAGSLTAAENGLDNLFSGIAGKSAEDADFANYPATERLQITLSDLSVLVFSHLLGWTSATQMDTGELYTFDDTYYDETDTRDAVSQRMIGKITADEFNTLLWNISATICDEQGAFQQALADVLAEQGVTRYQMRQVIDSIFKDEVIDPALDWVQPSHAIADDGALCTYDDVSYLFKKLVKFTDNVWEHSTDNVLGLVVSYDDYGSMVGFDATLPLFTEVLPYEGSFSYSVKHDENEQAATISHGELQLYNDNRIVGDLTAKLGQDVDGVNESSLNGYIDLRNTADGSSTGFGVNSASNFTVGTNDNGEDTEAFTGSLGLILREDGENSRSIVAAFEGETATDGNSFTTTADVSLDVTDWAKVTADVTLEQVDYEEIVFAGGQAIDLTNISDDEIQQIKNEVIAQGAKLSLALVLHPSVLSDLMTIVGQ